MDGELARAERWRGVLWGVFWALWGLRGLSLFVDLGPIEATVAVASWLALGAVLIETTARRRRRA